MAFATESAPDNRIGFHYFPDTLHYREEDLHTWLPELRSLGASWLILNAEPNRAIPELFLTGLLRAHIQPVLHIRYPLGTPPALDEARTLFESYARWGVRYVILFDKPNCAASWPATAWMQTNLVERFLDAYLPLALCALHSGLLPVFPPLEPGGDYWDTAFLIAALHGIIRRGGHELLQNCLLSAIARASNRPLDWGAGGPQRWPEALPYYTPQQSQDQRGLRIFEWYRDIAKAVTGQNCRLFLFQTGSALGDRDDASLPAIDADSHAQRNLQIARALSGAGEVSLPGGFIPPEVLAANFWLLSAAPGSPHAGQAWLHAGGPALPIVEPWKQWIARLQPAPPPAPGITQQSNHPIQHYLLLPSYAWGAAAWHLDAARNFILEQRPTIGFSLSEAALAAQVTILGGALFFPEEALQQLRAAGCRVERLAEGDGTEIASLETGPSNLQ